VTQKDKQTLSQSRLASDKIRSVTGKGVLEWWKSVDKVSERLKCITEAKKLKLFIKTIKTIKKV